MLSGFVPCWYTKLRAEIILPKALNVYFTATFQLSSSRWLFVVMAIKEENGVGGGGGGDELFTRDVTQCKN
jgi:hypothetical protein